MFSSDQLNDLMQIVMNKLEIDERKLDTNSKDNNCDREKINLNPSQILVILALLAGTLQVNSIVINREQGVDIILTGSLKKEEESEIDKIMKQLGHLPFDEVMKSMLKRFK